MFPTNDELFNLMILKGATGGAVVEATATGNPLSFLTDLAKPLKSLLVPFTPQQSGTGDPSPQNIRPLLPWNGMTVFGGGRNLFDASAVVRRDRFLLNDEGVEQPTSSSGYTLNRTKVKAGAVYTISGTIVKGSESCRLYFYNGDTFASRTSGINVGSIPYTFTVPQNCDGIAIQYNMGTVDFSTIQLEAGNTATAYEPYRPITETDIEFPSAVYGGTLDVVSGVLTDNYNAVEPYDIREYISYNSTYNVFVFKATSAQKPTPKINFKCLCNAYKYGGGYWQLSDKGIGYIFDNQFAVRDDSFSGDASAFGASLEGVIIVYEVAEPQTVALTPAKITAIKGQNTLWSDADGSMTAVYLKKK